MTNNFHKRRIAEVTKLLARDADAPQLGVHVMSEYIFCPRAGIVAYESKQDDSGSEFIPAPALGGLPSYEVDRIEAVLERLNDTLQRVLILFVSIAVVLAVIAVFDPTLGLITLTAAVVGATISGRLYWWDELRAYLFCKRQLQDARRAGKREPNWSLNAQQPVQWWELLKAGFDSRELNQSLHDQVINLKGKPWRILRRGDMHVPVVRMNVTDYDPGHRTQVKLREQQRARMAAYAYLIETCQRGQADWVIVLLNRSHDGLAVPLDQRHWQAFTDGLIKTRGEVEKLKGNMRHRPTPADGQRACVMCRLGKPRRVGLEPTIIAGTELPPYSTTSSDGKRVWHCTCGDRFQNVPPHKDAQALGLLDR